MIKIQLSLFTLFLALLVSAPSQAAVTTFGKGVHLEEVTKISQILDNPEKFVGQTVRVEGLIIDVCAKRGCWIYVAGDRPHEKIQVKVTDGEIVFPMSASGHLGQVEGIVEILEMSRDDILRYKQHLAEEKGEIFDPSAVTKGEKIVRLRGLGAKVLE